MRISYKVTYMSATEGSNKKYCEQFELFELALERYNEVLSRFKTYAAVKLIVETVLMDRA